jgi:hypothetical protein
MKDNNASSQIRSVVRLISRYSLDIFIIAVAAGLVGSIYVLTNIVNQPYSVSLEDSSITSFDQDTISKLSNLENSSKNIEYYNLPAGRIDPFSE